MRFYRDRLDDLLVKCDPASNTACGRQHSIILALASSKAAALQIEGYPRHKDQVQQV